MKRGLRQRRLIALLTFCWLGTLCLFAGCARTYTVSADYRPWGDPPAFTPPGREIRLSISSPRGPSDKTWYRLGPYQWLLEKEPALLVREALKEELGFMGISVIDDLSESHGRLGFEIRWFGPYGHDYTTAAVIISLALYSGHAAEPLWRGRIQAGAQAQEDPVTPAEKNRLVDQVLSQALTEAVMQLRWKPGFAGAMERLDTGR
ncbi:MAG: hypothetical protein V1758_00475 [Pseudomonadota bacterium]